MSSPCQFHFGDRLSRSGDEGPSGIVKAHGSIGVGNKGGRRPGTLCGGGKNVRSVGWVLTLRVDVHGVGRRARVEYLVRALSV